MFAAVAPQIEGKYGETAPTTPGATTPGGGLSKARAAP